MAEHVRHSPPREQVPRDPRKLLGIVLRKPLLLILCAIGIMQSAATHTFILYLPTIIDALLSGRTTSPGATRAAAAVAGKAPPRGLSLLPVVLTSIPYAVGALAAWIVAISSQARREVYWHAAVSMIFAGSWYVAFPFMARASIAAGFAALVLIAAGGSAAVPPKVALVARIGRGPAQSVSMPFYNSIAVVGGFVGPYVTGSILQTSARGFLPVAVTMGTMIGSCALLTLLVKALEARWDPTAGEARDDASDMEHGSKGGGEGNGGGMPVARKHSGVPEPMPGLRHGDGQVLASGDEEGRIRVRNVGVVGDKET